MRTILPAVAIVMMFTSLCGAGAAAAPKRNDRVYQAAMADREAALDLLRDIVNIDSGTGDIEGGTRVAAVLAERLRALGAEVRSEPAEIPGLPDNLLAVLHGTGKGRILIIAHFDTVFGPGTAAGRPFSMDGDRAHGPGVGDEKAGVVNAVMALKILHDLGFKNYSTITLLLDDSEERVHPVRANSSRRWSERTMWNSIWNRAIHPMRSRCGARERPPSAFK
jgi:glutamate carboxypeptidase